MCLSFGNSFVAILHIGCAVWRVSTFWQVLSSKLDIFLPVPAFWQILEGNSLYLSPRQYLPMIVFPNADLRRNCSGSTVVYVFFFLFFCGFPHSSPAAEYVTRVGTALDSNLGIQVGVGPCWAKGSYWDLDSEGPLGQSLPLSA